MSTVQVCRFASGKYASGQVCKWAGVQVASMQVGKWQVAGGGLFASVLYV